MSKPVVIFLQGGSIRYLKPEIFRGHDILCASLNEFESLKRFTPNNRFDIVCCYNSEEFYKRKGDIEKHLSENPEARFVTVLRTLKDHEEFANTFKNQIIWTKEYMYPENTDPNSLTLFLIRLVQSGYTKIALFGCDGLLHRDSHDVASIIDTYYSKDKMRNENRSWNLIEDTKNFNKYFTDLFYRELGENIECDIVNFNPASFIRTFQTLPPRPATFSYWYNVRRNKPPLAGCTLLQNSFMDDLRSRRYKEEELYVRYPTLDKDWMIDHAREYYHAETPNDNQQ